MGRARKLIEITARAVECMCELTPFPAKVPTPAKADASGNLAC